MSTSAENGVPTLHEFHDGDGHAEHVEDAASPRELISPDLRKYLAEIKGQAQFLLYLADQIEESLDQLVQEGDPCHGAFLCKVLGMYSAQLETKHQGLGEKIAETCQEVYVTVREREHG
ncbi:hypothetical protein [Planctomyces sp. SH-PL62]|uniref:hypothetical protein n=1 Tax=Planctomyces sp. SH-PL62 TaxID=1636152 RepID=UPI00078E3AA5|nr:hypothetical protein [Planctomyces sp. SH-PL62]AMV38298.1 hypothetical protein VT85_12730 [Planctomyces sp. SH-PL62]